MNTQVVLSDEKALGLVWLAAHWEKKLTKNLIKNHDITESVSLMKSPQTQIRLRVSGHLLLGVIKLFYRKALLILSEIEAMVIDIDNNKEQAKAASTKAASAEINMSAKKPKPLTYFENSLSASSLLQSARSSVEIARNRASKEEITLKEINYTPRSLRYSTELKSKEGLDIADNFLDDVASSMRFEEDMQLESYVLGPEMDLEMSDFVMPQPLIDKEKDSTDKISLATPKIAIKRAKKKSEKVEKHKSMKRLWIDDKETIMTQEYENLQQSVNEILRAHQIWTVKDYRLDAISLFQKPVIVDLPYELKEIYAPSFKYPTKLSEEEANQNPVMYEPEDLGSNHFGSPASLRPTDNIEPYENIAMANEMIEPIEPIFEPSPPVFDIKEDWSQRSAKMLVLLKQSMKRSHTIGYNSLAKGKERKVVAGGFYELLVIANKGYIDLKQDRNFSDLKIVKTEKFTSVNL